MSKFLKTESELLEILLDEVEKYDSDSKAAKAFGISNGHLSRVLREIKPITAKIALCLGYEMQVRFVPYEYRE